jgi:hypothetical protein
MSDTHGKAMNTLLRMVVPIRREFGRSLDVQTFLHDLEYRKEIIEQALQSQDTRLRDYAKYVQQLLGSPRTAADPPAPPAPPPAGAPAAAPASVIESAFASTEAPSTLIDPRAETKSREDELRDQILRKYTTGLR